MKRVEAALIGYSTSAANKTARPSHGGSGSWKRALPRAGCRATSVTYPARRHLGAQIRGQQGG